MYENVLYTSKSQAIKSNTAEYVMFQQMTTYTRSN